MNLLNETLDNIKPIDKEAMKKANERFDSLLKPIGSLGELEAIASKISGVTGKIYNIINKKNIIVMCADNGVCDEGISACPQNITTVMTNNFTRYITGVGVLSKFTDTDLTVVDIGVNGEIADKKVINKKISYGTKNMAVGPAMTREEAIKAIEVGIEIVDRLAVEGYDLLGTGEMGIGNTTSSAAVLAAISGLSPDILVGKGAGLTEEQFENKKNVVRRALEVNKPHIDDVIDVISKVGGLDIAGLCGCFLGAAKNRVPIVIDGFISSAAALCAYKLNPEVKNYMIASHLSAEPGAIYMMNQIGLTPMLNMSMRLGEGSGCPLAFQIIEAALYTIEHMGTFGDAMIVNDFLVDIR
jgi:nicotinate-nucleotide--dimethylbenzimidazole phosphoribosyltransferase